MTYKKKKKELTLNFVWKVCCQLWVKSRDIGMESKKLRQESHKFSEVAHKLYTKRQPKIKKFSFDVSSSSSSSSSPSSSEKFGDYVTHLAKEEKYRALGGQLWARGTQFSYEAEVFNDLALQLWSEAVLETHGNIEMKWKNWFSAEKNYICILATGETFKHQPPKS